MVLGSMNAADFSTLMESSRSARPPPLATEILGEDGIGWSLL